MWQFLHSFFTKLKKKNVVLIPHFSLSKNPDIRFDIGVKNLIDDKIKQKFQKEIEK